MKDFTNIDIEEMQDYFDEMIIGYQDGYGYTLLHYICGKQYMNIINFLISNQQHIIIKSNNSEEYTLKDYTLEDYINENINIVANSTDQYTYYLLYLEQIVKLLSKQCKQGIHVRDIDSYTPLYHAIFYHPDSKNITRLLMHYGCKTIVMRR